MGGAEPRRIAHPFTTETSCLLVPPERAEPGRRPPLLVALHGQGQDGARHRGWMGTAVPPHFASAWPDGFHKHEVRKEGAPTRIGCGWYLFTGDQPAFIASLVEAERALWGLIDAAIAELDADPARVWLCGFSQGAYLAHCAAVRAPRRVAGWVAQSGRLKLEFLRPWMAGVAGKPVLIQHGRIDPHLPPNSAETSAAALTEAGAQVTLRLYDAGHAISPAMAEDCRQWLDEREPAAVARGGSAASQPRGAAP